MDEHAILRPAPRKPGTLNLSPITTTTYSERGLDSSEPSPSPQTQQSSTIDSTTSLMTPETLRRNGDTPQKSRSILNLTSSTLYGIYSPSGYDSSRDEPLTPWGTGAQTPARTSSLNAGHQATSQITAKGVREKTRNLQGKERQGRHVRARSHSGPRGWQSRTRNVTGFLLRTVALSLIGLAYGGIVTQLHDTSSIAPVQVDGFSRRSWLYLGFWGASGIVLGNLLPWVDRMWGRNGRTAAAERAKEEDYVLLDEKDDQLEKENGQGSHSQGRSSLGANWNPIVRSIGAFVGVAFAIRRLPWQSTLQASLTLALANPVIWYLLDRSRNGLFLSTAFALTGALTLVSINPAVLPTPIRTPGPGKVALGTSVQNASVAAAATVCESGGWDAINYESIGVATWVSSVLFCSCVCFGNIGRRLAAGGGEK